MHVREFLALEEEYEAFLEQTCNCYTQEDNFCECDGAYCGCIEFDDWLELRKEEKTA